MRFRNLPAVSWLALLPRFGSVGLFAGVDHPAEVDLSFFKVLDSILRLIAPQILEYVAGAVITETVVTQCCANCGDALNTVTSGVMVGLIDCV